MKKRFLILRLLLIMGFVSVCFISCNNSEPDTPKQTITVLKAENIIGNTSNVTTVKLGQLSWRWFNGVFVGERYDVFAETPFVNNGFALNLPEYMEDENLGSPFLWILPDDAVVSGKNVRLHLQERLDAFDANGNNIGFFGFKHETDGKLYEVFWSYADRPASARSKELLDSGIMLEHNVNYQKGWNITYRIIDTANRITLWTTEKPAGVELRWYFYGNSDAE